jgi:hypothetical protein
MKRGLVKMASEDEYHNPTHPGPALSLTYEGLLEAEKLVAKRLGSQSQETTMTKEKIHTVIQNFHAPVGSIQTGQKSKSYVAQHIGANLDEILNLISQLRNEIENSALPDKEDALEVVEALSEEVKRGETRKGRLKAFMRQIGEFTTDTASNAIATIISKQLGLD